VGRKQKGINEMEQEHNRKVDSRHNRIMKMHDQQI
jgi:hypothetical protein